jgi:carbonic anhydrase/acetyltransferase-like protein (isoleucine patch superfamily)
MASRTVVDSIDPVSGPPANLAEIDTQLAQLRARFPGATLDRYLHYLPQLGDKVHLAPTAALIGRVRLHDEVSIWHGAVLRADINTIEVRERSNVQDGTIVHLGDDDATFVGEEVVVGHRVVLHGCHIEGGCLVGIGAIVLDGARIGHGSVVGAGALVTAGTVVPPHSLVLGTPAKVIKTLSSTEEDFHRKLALKYTRLSHNYRVG